LEVAVASPKKVAGLAVLLAFVLGVAGAAGLFEDDCCSPACESCPIIYCKTAPAVSSPKVDIAGGAAPSTPAPAVLAARPALGRSLAQIPAFLSHEFRRPMRN
jgi:hypothetical protein